jgi:hypothetical protein
MLHRNDGKNIAILFFARARTAVKCASGVVFVVVLCSTGLTSEIFAAAKMPPKLAESSANAVQLDTLKPFKNLRLTRTNVANRAYEELTIDEKSAILKRSTGFQKSIALEQDVFQTIEKNIRDLHAYTPKAVVSQDGRGAEGGARPPPH